MIVFHMLSKEHVASIVDILMRQINKRIKDELDITVEPDDKAKAYIVDKGYDEKYGARPLKRALQTLIEDELAEQILEVTIKAGSRVMVTMDKMNEKLVFSVK